MNYKSDIQLSEEYEHVRTGLTGHAISIYFFENACERVSIQYLHDGEVKEAVFDAVELRAVATKKRAASLRPGGVRGPATSAEARH